MADKLLTNILGFFVKSQGGAGSDEAGKVVEFLPTGGIQASAQSGAGVAGRSFGTTNLNWGVFGECSGDAWAVCGTCNNTGYGGVFSSLQGTGLVARSFSSGTANIAEFRNGASDTNMLYIDRVSLTLNWKFNTKLLQLALPVGSINQTWTLPDKSGTLLVDSDIIPLAINVKSPPYNAVGDGVANDTIAIQAAIDAAGAGQKIVFFPRGIYKCNIVLGNTANTQMIRLFGAGAGSTGDWDGSVHTPATALIPNNNALPVIRIEALGGIQLQDFEIRGNNAGVTANGLLVDTVAAGGFVGNGLSMENIIIRRCTYNFRSDGGCNISLKQCGLFQGTYAFYVDDSAFAHSYTLDLCSLGGMPATGTGRCFHIVGGSFVNIMNCEQGNCTDYLYMTGACVITIVGGNWETLSATAIINMLGGSLNITGGRFALANGQTIIRVNGTPATIGIVTMVGAFFGATIIPFETNGFDTPFIRGIGSNKKLRVWNSDFTVMTSETLNDRLLGGGRMTVTQNIAGAGVHIIIPNVGNIDVGGKYSTTTGRFTPGKAGYYRVTASLRVSAIGAYTKMMCFVNGSSIATLAALTNGGPGTVLSGSCIVYLNATGYADIRLETPGACTVDVVDNYTSQIYFEEIDNH